MVPQADEQACRGETRVPSRASQQRSSRSSVKVARGLQRQCVHPDFWINSWETDNIPWQAPVVSPWLEEFMDKCLSNKPRTIFVPLCSKTRPSCDRDYRVVGADCSGVACVDFLPETRFPTMYARLCLIRKVSMLCAKGAPVPIALYEGHFDLTPEEIVGPIDRNSQPCSIPSFYN